MQLLLLLLLLLLILLLLLLLLLLFRRFLFSGDIMSQIRFVTLFRLLD